MSTLNNESHVTYKVFCLISPNGEVKGLSKTIEANIVSVFQKLGRQIELEKPTCCQSAFSALSNCRSINIRFFSTDKNCYSSNVLKYVSTIAEHIHAINIEIVEISNSDHLKRYDPSTFNQTIVVTPDELEDIVFLESIVKTIIKPVHIYISYGNDSNGEGRSLVTMLEKATTICLPYVKLVYDFQKKYKDDIQGLIEEIKNGEYIVIILNDKYILSEYCMAEYLGILEKSNSSADFVDKIYPIILKSGEKIYSKKELTETLEVWHERLREIESTINKNKVIAEQLNLYQEKVFIEQCINHISNINSTLGRLVSFDKTTHVDNKFSKIIWLIHEKMVLTGAVRLYHAESDIKKILNEVIF